MRARLAIVAGDVKDASRTGSLARIILSEREQLLGCAQSSRPVDAIVATGRERVQQDAARVRPLRACSHPLNLSGKTRQLPPPLDRARRDIERLVHHFRAPAAPEHPGGCQLLLVHTLYFSLG